MPPSENTNFYFTKFLSIAPTLVSINQACECSMNTHERLLLDTCIVSQFAYKNPPTELITWVKTFPDIYFAISISTVIEIQKGIENLRSCGSARADALEEWLDQLIASDLLCLNHDVKTARIIGRMISIPALKSLWIPDPNSKSPSSDKTFRLQRLQFDMAFPSRRRILAISCKSTSGSNCRAYAIR